MKIKYDDKIHNKALEKLLLMKKQSKYQKDCVRALICPSCSGDLEVLYEEVDGAKSYYCDKCKLNLDCNGVEKEVV